MNIEELKLILDTIQGVTNGAVAVAITYFILNALVPLLKYTIVGVSVYKVVQLFTRIVVVEKK